MPVLVHGAAHDPGRVTTAEIFDDLGLPIATRRRRHRTRLGAPRAGVRAAPSVLCPPLARLLDVRRVVGLRNPATRWPSCSHPCRQAPALRVGQLHAPRIRARCWPRFLGATRADAMLLRGTEGEPVADPRRAAAARRLHRRAAARRPVARRRRKACSTELPVLPRSNDAATTALYIQAVLSGAKPAPGAARAAGGTACVARGSPQPRAARTPGTTA